MACFLGEKFGQKIHWHFEVDYAKTTISLPFQAEAEHYVPTLTLFFHRKRVYVKPGISVFVYVERNSHVSFSDKKDDQTRFCLIEGLGARAAYGGHKVSIGSLSDSFMCASERCCGRHFQIKGGEVS